MPVTSERCLAKLPTCDVSCHGRRHAGRPFVRTVTFGGAILLKTMFIVLLVGHVYDLVGHLMPQAFRRSRLLNQDGRQRARHRLRYDLSFHDTGECDRGVDRGSPYGRKQCVS